MSMPIKKQKSYGLVEEVKMSKNRKRIAVIFLAVIFLFPGAYQVLNLEKTKLTDEIRSSLPGDTVTMSGGTTYYEFAGDNTGPVVILVHGFSTPSYIWDPNYAYLDSENFRVLRYDLFGRGYSDRPRVDYGLDLFVSQLDGLVTALGLSDEPLNLIGLSLGGSIVAAYANAFPARVDSLTLIDPYTLPASGSQVFPLNVPLVGEYITAVYLVPFMLPNTQPDDFYNPELFPDWVERYRVQLQYKGFHRAILSTIRNMEDISGIDEYAQLNGKGIPVLLVWGKEDKSIPRDQIDRILAVLQDIELHEIDFAAHLPHYERPDIVNPFIENFLKKE